MDIQLEKLTVIEMIEQTNDLSILSSIKSLFRSEKKDFWDELTVEQKFEIEECDREIDRGEYVDFEVFIKKYV